MRYHREASSLGSWSGELETTSDVRVLLLMDNAVGSSQVALLSPPRGCLLLVTSRSHFTLPGLVARNLDELPHEDACALLLKIAPRIGGAAEVLLAGAARRGAGA